MDEPAASPTRLVLDTNATLDWLLFADPRMDAVAAAIVAGRARWFATAAMRAELEHVVARPSLGKHEPDGERILTAFDAHAVPHPAGAGSPRLACRDRDDQIFIDLAFDLRPAWLMTHDRALLALARRAAAVGVVILRPGQPAAAWCVGPALPVAAAG